MARDFLIALLHFIPFGPRSLARLFGHFGSAEAIWKASAEELAVAEVEATRLANFVAWRLTVNPEKLLQNTVVAGVEIVSQGDPRYPLLLSTIHDPPIGFFVKGTLPPPQLPLISIVGSRRGTAYGKKVASTLAYDLAKRGVGIVSGLAMGIDSAAHEASLEAGGYTLAVIAQGHNSLSSRQRKLAERIVAQGGAVVSEYPPHFEPKPFNFPIRNRIISGLSKGTVIVEATLKSGSRITAQSAIDQNREVFAVPGPIDSSNSEGTNQLIKDGAYVARHDDDVMDVLGLSSAQMPSSPSIYGGGWGEVCGDGQSEALITILSRGALHIDELSRETGRPTTELLAALTYLELDGKVRNLGNMMYSL